MIIRLHPDHDGHWALYEAFERKCRLFAAGYGWPMPAQMVLECRRRFIECPALAGYFITDDMQAHMLAWFVREFDEPGIRIMQAEGPRGGSLVDLFKPAITALLTWKHEIEAVIKQPVMFIELNSEDHAEEWIRLFRQLGSIRQYGTLRVTLSDEQHH